MRTANLRGAFVLGALLAAILVLAVAIALRIYTQLDNAARVERALVVAQLQLDAILRVQLEESSALRGYPASGQRHFIDPYTGDTAPFTQTLRAFETTTERAGIARIGATIEDIKSLHETWVATVARPLRAQPHARDARARQTLGKVLVDRLRGDTMRVHEMLDFRLLAAQTELKDRINEALVAGLSTILLFGIVSIAFVLSRAKMLAAIDRERSFGSDETGALLDDEGAMKLFGAAPIDPQLCADELAAAVKKRNEGAVRDDLAIVAIAIDTTKGTE